MSIENRIESYNRLADENRQNAAALKKQIYTNGTLRLTVFLAGAAGIYFCWHNAPAAIAMAAATSMLFAWLLKRHNRLSRTKDLAETLTQIAEDELKAFRHDYSPFDGAAEKTDPQHPFSFDLDIFGEHSVFQLINRTSIPEGKERLAQFLQRPLTSAAEIEKRQEAVRELSGEEDFCLNFRAVGLLTKHADAKAQKTDAKKTLFRQHSFWKIAVAVAPISYLVFIALQISGIVSGASLLTLYLLTLVFSTLPLKKVKKIHQSFDKKAQTFESYAQLLKKVEDARFGSTPLKSIQSQLSQNKRASEAILQLSQHIRNLDLAFAFPVLLLLNPVFLWNVRYALKIERWIQQYADETEKWFSALAEIDALVSLGTFAANHPDYAFPRFSESFEFKGKNLGHPLIPREKCVPNDIDISQKPFFMIVTGANMAGKSTYLRTIGVNHLLASIGAPVYADSLRFYPGRLLTNLRTADSLVNSESYFFAELKRLKMIIDTLQSDEEDGLFIILDEILKGTNSEDKQKGSFALMRRFVKLSGNGIIATHDLALGALETEFPQAIRNYHFDADISGDTLSFDYRLRQGIAKNMNAGFLMKTMGIIE